ncbi:hypothetical protein [Pleomorphomonas sp. NRK KF1]|uniref:hypothetical protein n=1 Tax=Pleomorphomonas sp. NRK KF1 TaxID=2943000 RepID=UPI00204353DA|nr:hypothetical protein [Pleomorphomonas sp. NRK KF1]MCM5553288.1 hypothetical protein [Pleomorphomonas sp. NRK KF1]
MSTHTRLYDTWSDAMTVVDRLRAARIPNDDISVISPESDENRVSDGAEATAAGSGIGAVLGGGAGALAGVGMLAIPGLGPIVATGWFVSTLAGLAAGAVAGGVAGGIVDALTSSGLTPEEAQVYAEAIRRGGTMVTVRVDDSEDPMVARLLDETPPVNLTEREQLYRESGWTGFDPALDPRASDLTRRPPPG